MLGIASQQQIDMGSANSILSVSNSSGNSNSTLISNSWWAAGGTDVFESKGVSVISDMDILNYPELLKLIDNEPENNAQLINALYMKYRLDTFEKLRGAFSLCIIDKKNHKIIVVTDRFGLKPVYYYSDSKYIIFGSRIKEILSSPQLKCQEIDYEAVVDYINLSAIPTPKTIYKNIRKLPPGHFLVIDKKNMTPHISKYYDIEYTETKSGEEYFLNKLPLSIENSVKTIIEHELSRGSKIGTFLSGGIDSSTITGMIKKLSGQVKSFSIGFDEEGYNELDFARIAAKHFGAEHYEYMVTPEDVLDTIDIILDVYDEPFGNASVVPTYFCALLAKEHGIDSLLAGDGGDEIFGGNERYVSDKVFNYYHHIPRFLRKGFIEPAVSIMPALFAQVERGKNYIKRANISQPDRFFSYNPIMAFGMEKMFSSDFLHCLNGYDPNSWARELYSKVNSVDELSRLLYIDMKFAITDNDIRKVSDVSEKAGISVFYPFLDHKLVDFAATIPSGLKVKGTYLRYIFKKSVEDFLPSEIIKKKKHGFGLPIGLWINKKQNIRSFVRETLIQSDCVIRSFFNNNFIENLFRQHDETGASYCGDIIWVLFSYPEFKNQ